MTGQSRLAYRFPANGQHHPISLEVDGETFLESTIGSLCLPGELRKVKKGRLRPVNGKIHFTVTSLEHGKGMLILHGKEKKEIELVWTPTVQSIFLDWAESIVFAFLAYFLIRSFLLETFVIPTGSMIPTLNPGDRVFALKSIYWFRKPYRGEIVIFKAPPEPDKNYVKRVIGLPGDEIRISDGETYINGHRLNEPYVQNKPLEDFPPVVVPENSLFVMGDNRPNSRDSRYWKFLPFRNLVGKPIFRFWPLWRIQVLKSYPLPTGSF